MFHGVKKSEVKPLTEAEIKKNQETLTKIRAIQQKILQIRSNPGYDQKDMDFLLKSCSLMPDFPSIWNIRKEKLEHFISSNPWSQVIDLMKREIKSIFPIMMKNPKSYLLWYHRVWCLSKVLEIETSQNIPLEQCIIMPEIELCNKFTLKDDRNFHCWNYRVQLLTLINKHYAHTFNTFVLNELKYTLDKIKVNFSNFSAWNYRAKLIAIHFFHHNIAWNTPTALAFFNDDLQLLKQALYTDPKDQSPWNYHHWLCCNFIPIYVTNVRVDTANNTVSVKYSNVFKIKSVVNVSNAKGITVDNANAFSDTLKLTFDPLTAFEGDDTAITVTNKVSEEIKVDFDNLSMITNKVCFTKENLTLPTVYVHKDGKVKVVMDNVMQFQMEFLKEQVTMVKELIEQSTGMFVENAHHRLAQLYHAFYMILVVSQDEKEVEEAKEYRKKEIEEYKVLMEKSKRMNNMYRSILQELLKEEEKEKEMGE